MSSMKQIEASSILNISPKNINGLIKKGILKKSNPLQKNSQLDSDSVYQYQKELEERRNITPAKWIYRNDY